MSKIVITALVLVVLVAGAALVALNLPVRLYAGNLLEGIEYTDMEGASLLSGDLWVNADRVQGPMHIQYNWCPGRSPGRWCVSFEHLSAKLDTFLVLRGLSLISFEQMQIQELDLQALGVAGGLLDARVSGQIEKLDWVPNDCPLAGINELQGFLTVPNLGILGSPTGSHRLNMTTVSEGINMNLGGDTFSGDIEIRGPDYSAQGELIAPESMLSMARSLMRPLGGNRFGWQISGKLPC